MKSALFIFHAGASLAFIISTLLFVASCLTARAQSPQSPSQQSSSISLSTEMRVRGPGWWPTKGTTARSEFTGPDACTECHELRAETAQSTAMFHAATREPDSKSLRDHPNLPFQTGPFTYQLLTTPEQSSLTVGNATSSFLWALGSGHMVL